MSSSIDVDGHIDLIDKAPAAGHAGLDVGRVKQARLNDIMIVLERDRDPVAGALQERLAVGVLKDASPEILLTLDEATPKFRVAVSLGEPDAVQLPLSKADQSALETEIATELHAAIGRRAGGQTPRRWQPSVTATVLQAQQARPIRIGSIWLRVLFLLMTSIVVGVSYLYFASSL